MAENKNDFRYAVGPSKVPWTAVGEYYNADDVKEFVKFLLPDKEGKPGYDEAFAKVSGDIDSLARVASRASKLTLGDHVVAAEAAARKTFNSKYALLTNCWTSGMEIGFKLSGVEPGDEVIMPAITFIATMSYPLSIGAKIVFVDVDPETMNMDPADLERKITPKTKLIVPVHLGGYPCDMDPIMEIANRHGIYVMEDAAHGMGGMYKGRYLGAIGHFGGFSLHEVKNITSLGEGGILLTNEDFAGKQLPQARFLGLDGSRQIKDWLYDIVSLRDRFGNVKIAGNSSITEAQALGLELQMARLNQIIAARRKAAEYTNSVLAEEDGILIERQDTPDTYGTHHLYLLRIDPQKIGGDIRALEKKLKEKGLTNITHFGPMYRFQVMKDLGYDEDAIAATCPVTERMFYTSYTHLPIYNLTQEQIEYQAQAIVESVREMKSGK